MLFFSAAVACVCLHWLRGTAWKINVSPATESEPAIPHAAAFSVHHYKLSGRTQFFPLIRNTQKPSINTRRWFNGLIRHQNQLSLPFIKLLMGPQTRLPSLSLTKLLCPEVDNSTDGVIRPLLKKIKSIKKLIAARAHWREKSSARSDGSSTQFSVMVIKINSSPLAIDFSWLKTAINAVNTQRDFWSVELPPNK